MQENNFEKNIQQRMEELQLNPSGDVWLKVEATLTKKKDRRAVFLLLFLLLFCGGAGFMYFVSYSPATTKQIAKANPAGNQIKPAAAPVITKTIAADSPSKNLPQSSSDLSVKKEAAEGNDITDPGSKSIKQKQHTAFLLREATDNNLPTATVDRNKTALVKKQQNRFKTAATTTVMVSGALIETTEETVPNNSLLKQHTTFNLINITAGKIKTGAPFNALMLIKPDISEAAIVTNNIIKKTSSVNKKVTGNGNKKITTAFSFSAGRAASANNYLGKIPNNSFYDYLSSSPLNNNTGVPDSLLAVNRNASPIKPGAGFEIGILFIKKLSSQLYLPGWCRFGLWRQLQSVLR